MEEQKTVEKAAIAAAPNAPAAEETPVEQCAPVEAVDSAEGGAAVNKKGGKAALKEYFTATRISFMAIFTALSYVLTLFDFPLLPGTPVTFLKLDFSNVFVMLAGFSLGPVSGCIVALLKELIHALTVGHTAFVGELANVLFVLPYMLIPAIVYKRHKGIKVVIVTLALGCVAQCLVSLPVNYFLNFPAFTAAFGGSWKGGQQLFEKTWYWALLFNFIKAVIISAATLVIYKPLSRLIKRVNRGFTERGKTKKGAQEKG